MRRTLLAITCLLAFGAQPVLAAPPIGACPPAFTAAEYEDIVAMVPGLEEADVIALLGTIDANGDGTVCYRPHPTWSTSFETRNNVVNVVDNHQAAGQS